MSASEKPGLEGTSMYNDLPPAYPGVPVLGYVGPVASGYSNPGSSVAPGYLGPGGPVAQGYPGPPGGPIVQQPSTILLQTFRDTPVQTKCQQCQAEVITATHHEAGIVTWLVMGILCASCLWWGPCLIPLCLDSAKDVIHTCPNCKATLGQYDRRN